MAVVVVNAERVAACGGVATVMAAVGPSLVACCWRCGAGELMRLRHRVVASRPARRRADSGAGPGVACCRGEVRTVWRGPSHMCRPKEGEGRRERKERKEKGEKEKGK
jgi:hypothetical protein